jgi:hypothetical protein
MKKIREKLKKVKLVGSNVVADLLGFVGESLIKKIILNSGMINIYHTFILHNINLWIVFSTVWTALFFYFFYFFFGVLHTLPITSK